MFFDSFARQKNDGSPRSNEAGRCTGFSSALEFNARSARTGTVRNTRAVSVRVLKLRPFSVPNYPRAPVYRYDSLPRDRSDRSRIVFNGRRLELYLSPPPPPTARRFALVARYCRTREWLRNAHNLLLRRFVCMRSDLFFLFFFFLFRRFVYFFSPVDFHI